MKKSTRSGIAGLMLLCGTTSLSAAVVADPVPQPILPGLTVKVTSFLRSPDVGPNFPYTRVQSLQPIRDGSNRLFISDLRGAVLATNTAGAAPTVYFDPRAQGVQLAERSSGMGLIGLAFHPNFGRDATKSGYNQFYTTVTVEPQTGTAGLSGKGPISHHNLVQEWTVADPHAATATVTASREVMRVAQPTPDHGPGTIAFNPAAAEGSADYGKLYIGFGDGGGVNDPFDNAQDLSSPFGKILRIDPSDPDGAGARTYSIPPDNPFSASSTTLGEVWAYGLRNPQQFGWDTATGAMYIADIGQKQIEEVDLGLAGANYGWPAREGTFGRSSDKAIEDVFDTPSPGGFNDPIAQYDHDEGASIGAAVLYRGSEMPELFGAMLTTDIVNGRIFYFTPGATDGVGGLPLLRELQLTLDGEATSMMALEGTGGQQSRVDLRMGVDALGELYLLTKKDGDIYRLSTVAAVPEPGVWAMMMAGLGVIAGMLRSSARRRRAAATA